jgi:hypothetical protein
LVNQKPRLRPVITTELAVNSLACEALIIAFVREKVLRETSLAWDSFKLSPPLLPAGLGSAKRLSRITAFCDLTRLTPLPSPWGKLFSSSTAPVVLLSVSPGDAAPLSVDPLMASLEPGRASKR